MDLVWVTMTEIVVKEADCDDEGDLASQPTLPTALARFACGWTALLSCEFQMGLLSSLSDLG